MLIFLFNLVWSVAFVKKPAAANPWASRSIEFQLPSPVPVHNFDRIPVFSSDPYGYGEGPPPTWVVPAGAPAGRE
jgi:cytochrome c oxidase subunit 1